MVDEFHSRTETRIIALEKAHSTMMLLYDQFKVTKKEDFALMTVQMSRLMLNMAEDFETYMNTGKNNFTDNKVAIARYKI